MKSRAVAITVLSFVVFFSGITFVLAEEGREGTASVSSSPKPERSLFGLFRNDDRGENHEASESPKPFRLKTDRLKELRLKACEAHQGEINTRSGSLAKLVDTMVGKFDAIVTRVEEYYLTKAVPAGKVVTNYDELVADIAAKKIQISTDLDTAKKDVSDFSCTGDNPKGQITEYRTDMQLVKKDLQAYRTSIKNLLVAIRSAVGKGEKESPKPSASPI